MIHVRVQKQAYHVVLNRFANESNPGGPVLYDQHTEIRNNHFLPSDTKTLFGNSFYDCHQNPFQDPMFFPDAPGLEHKKQCYHANLPLFLVGMSKFPLEKLFPNSIVHFGPAPTLAQSKFHKGEVKILGPVLKIVMILVPL